jgi:hypothetical protein
LLTYSIFDYISEYLGYKAQVPSWIAMRGSNFYPARRAT